MPTTVGVCVPSGKVAMKIRLFEIAPAPPTNFPYSHWSFTCKQQSWRCERERLLDHATQWQGKWYWKSQSIWELNCVVAVWLATAAQNNAICGTKINCLAPKSTAAAHTIRYRIDWGAFSFSYFCSSAHTSNSLQRYVATHYTRQPENEWMRRRGVVANQHHRT